MDVASQTPPAPGLTTSAAPSDDLKLVAEVAYRKVAAAIRAEPNETVLYSIEGLGRPVTRAVVRAIANGIPKSLVRVHPFFDASDDPLPAALLSDEPPAHWRNLARDASTMQAIVFAADGSNIDTAGETIAAIRKLDMQALLDDVTPWLEACPFAAPLNQDSGDWKYFHDALEGLTRTDLILNLPMFAQFVLRLASEYDNHPVNGALDAALPALRLPRDAGKLRPLAGPGRRLSPSGWVKTFSKIEKDTRDKLYLRNDRGAPLERSGIVKRADKLAEEGVLSPDARDAVVAMTNDRQIEAGRWTATQEAFVQHTWAQTHRVFTQGRTESKKLGDETIKFFDDEHPATLTDEDKTILKSFTGTPGQDVQDEEREFFLNNREVLRTQRDLHKRWERAIFQQVGTHTDLLAGIVQSLSQLLSRAEVLPDAPRLHIKLDGAEKKSFWQDKNTALCRLLKYRYRGLPEALEPFAHLDFGLCWSKDWESDIHDDNTSRSTEATEFRFSAKLLAASASQDSLGDAPLAQFVWKLPGNVLAGGFAADLHAIAPNDMRSVAALLAGEFLRNPKTDRGQDRRIHLADNNSLLDAYKGGTGELFNPNNPALDMGTAFLTGLERMQAEHMFGNPGTAAVEALRSAFLAFRDAYTRAIEALVQPGGAGLTHPALLEQAQCYGTLLKALRQWAAFPRAYNDLWRAILRIGVATNHGIPIAIVTPLAPLRLAELSAKALQLGDLLRSVFEENREALEELEVLFDVEAVQLAASYYGDVALSAGASKIRLLAETDRLADYSLLEPPVIDDPGNGGLYDIPPKESVDQFLYVAEHYLEIQPHERANFSCVLYNAESRELPAMLTDKLGRKIESEDDLRCDLILTHDDPTKLRRIYTQQNAAIGGELDAVLASEATRSFLSRLRVGFNDVNDVSGMHHSQADLVLLQEVLSRHALLTWRRCEAAEFPDLRTHKPSAWSRQCPFNPQDQTSAVYLTAPVQPDACQRYVDGLHAVLSTDQQIDGSTHYLPVCQINYGEDRVRSILEKAHAIGDWVVTHDSIADRRLFENHGIRIIRYLTRPGTERKLIVSTRKPSDAIGTTLRERIGYIDPALGTEDLAAIVDTSLEYAARLSGQVVLRAAQNEQRALELLGLALTRSCIARAFDRDADEMVWFFLDDYASWLGHREGKVADILTLVPNRDGETLYFDLVVAESKFVSKQEWRASLTKAKRQLLNTIEGLRRRLLRETVDPEQSIWCRRLSELFFEHTNPTQMFFEHPAEHWANAVRDGSIPMRLRGGIFEFVYDQDEDFTDLEDETEQLPDGQALFAFNRIQTGQLLKGLADLSTTMPRCRGLWASEADAKSSDGPGTAETQTPSSQTGSHSGNPPGTTPDDGATSSDNQETHGEADVNQAGAQWPKDIQEFLRARNSETDDPAAREWLERTGTTLRQALLNYGLKPKIVETRLTPNAGLIRFAGSDNLTVEKIKRKQLELKTSHAVDVIRVIPGLGEVIVLVRRPDRVVLALEQLWARRALPATAPQENLNLLLGEREDNGQLLFLNLRGPFGGQPEHAPHCLIAGESGSGKGVLVQNLLLDLCATNAPENLNIVMIDPKAGVDYTWLEEMPHVRDGLLTEQEQAVEALDALVIEMNRRYVLFRDVKAKKLSQYNQKVAADARLPFICLFHDEMTDWMLIPEYRDAVTKAVSQLATKARAAGIHLFFIAQRPDKDALPMQLRANLGNRLALKVADEKNSRIVLDDAGAEDLLGQGHLAAKLSGEGQPILAQVPFLGEEASEELAAMIRRFWLPR